eukprot:5691981-Pyramimonas_sp.AAC.1
MSANYYHYSGNTTLIGRRSSYFPGARSAPREALEATQEMAQSGPTKEICADLRDVMLTYD